MEKFEIFKLRLCKGLFDGIISDYILAVVKNTEHILEVPILAEILDDSYVTKFKNYIHDNDLKFQIDNCVLLPENLRFIYGSVSKFSLNGEYVRKFNNFYSSIRTVKYNSVEYKDLYTGQVPDGITLNGPIALNDLPPIVYTEISVFCARDDRRCLADIADRIRKRYYLPFSATSFPCVSRSEFDKSMSDKTNKNKKLQSESVYKLYNVRVQPDRKHFRVNLYNEHCVYEPDTIDYELCDSVWASELLPYQGRSANIPEYNSEGLPLGILWGHNILGNLSFQPSYQIIGENRQIRTDKYGYHYKDSQVWAFCLVSKVDEYGNWVYIKGYDPIYQRMQIEEKKYKPTPEAIESEINDIYVEDIDLEEYRHRFRNSDFSKSVSESTSSIEYVDFNVRYDKYSSYSMYPFICLPIMETPIMPYRIQKRVYNRGIQEDSFEKMLSRFIKDPYEVRSDIGLVNDSDLCYEPDIAIVRQGHPHVHIDIEIDEPYSVNNEPIHYIECDNDQKRNKYFVDHGWIVISFSERQITLYPKGCLKVVEDVLSSIDSTYLPEKNPLNEQIVSERHWSLEEARQMIAANERSKYLGLDIVQKSVPNSGETFPKQQLTESEKRVRAEIKSQNESDLQREEVQELSFSAQTGKKVSWWRRILRYFIMLKNR